ncbi:MAG: Nif3-like dinuclear metal center hexameric protein [Bacteroidetes bacterium]|nr:Nif3-like dinuclear metal center hexameric protein [Bacteroidota bacterium]
MNVSDFITAFEKVVPPAIAWKGDNVGLQIGKPENKISSILLALDVTLEVVHEAIAKKANLIVTHHPLLFHPLKRISPDSRAGAIAMKIIEHNISLYAAHTNLDSVKNGVNFALGKKLGLKNLAVLSPVKESLTKIAVFVPLTHVEAVAEAMHSAGAGMFSKYDLCSFRTKGTGTFRGMNNASPYIGKVGMTEKVEEARIEMLCEHWKLSSVLRAMIKAHPYEEVAYDIYPLENMNSEYGLGAVGTLSNALSVNEFLRYISHVLKTPSLRYTPGNKKTKIKTVALCGGSGAEFIPNALAAGAEAFITADLKYHTFQEYEDRILLIDAGHFETEHIVLDSLRNIIQHIVGKACTIYKTKKNTNPVHYYTS